MDDINLPISLRDILMNPIHAITTHSQHLPEHLQKEVLDFISICKVKTTDFSRLDFISNLY
jgi:hypothetical protein